MRIIGIIMIIISSCLFGRWFRLERDRAVSELYSFLCFLKFASERANFSFEPTSATARRYTDSFLEDEGFLVSLREGARLSSAVSALVQNLKIDGSHKTEILTLSRGIEDGSCEDYRRGLRALVSAVEKIYLSVSDTEAKHSRAIRVTALAGGLGLAILML